MPTAPSARKQQREEEEEDGPPVIEFGIVDVSVGSPGNAGSAETGVEVGTSGGGGVETNDMPAGSGEVSTS